MSTCRAGTWATAAAAESGDRAARAQVVPAELVHQFRVDAGGVHAPLNAKLARGYPATPANGQHQRGAREAAAALIAILSEATKVGG